MAGFIQVANVAEVPDPGKLLVEVEDRLVALFHVGGEWFALDDVCTHDGGPLAEGKLDGHTIACPRHGAQFDIRSGAALSMPATKPTAAHEVKVEAGQVWVKLRDGEQGSGERVRSSEFRVQESGGGGKGSEFRVQETKPDLQEQGDKKQEAKVAVASADHAVADYPAVSEDGVRESLKQVVDPELFVNIIDLGLVYVVDLRPPEENIEGKTNVQIEMTLTSPACPAGPQLIQQTHQAVGRLRGVGQVNVRLVMDPPWTPDRMTDAARDQLGIF